MAADSKGRDCTALNRAARDIFLEASEDELREAFAGTGEDLEALADRGREVVRRALAGVHSGGAAGGQ